MEPNKKILIVDDNKVDLQIYSDVLSEKYAVVSVSSAEDAIDILLKNPAEIGLIVTDIVMARMSGWELVATVRKHLKKTEIELPIIVISAVDSNELEFNCFKYGANAWLTKPIHPLSKLTSTVEKLFGDVQTPYHMERSGTNGFVATDK